MEASFWSDALEARALRDEGIERVASPALADQLATFLLSRVGEEMTGEDIRMESGATAHHPNAWGAAIMGLTRRGLLIKTGEYRQMVRPSSHARVNPVYKVWGP